MRESIIAEFVESEVTYSSHINLFKQHYIDSAVADGVVTEVTYELMSASYQI